MANSNKMGEQKCDDPAFSGQPQRQRATHKRSRNGCSTCKRRHIRCDESKPICTKCLVKGTDCQYNDDSYPTTPSPASTSSTVFTAADLALLTTNPLVWQSPQAPTSLPADWAGNFGIDVPTRSHEMLQHSNYYRQVVADMIPTHHRTSTPASTREPLYLHTMVLWACMHLYFQQGCSMGQLEQTCLHHKVEVMQALKQQQHVASADDDEKEIYAGAILCLAVVEAAMDNTEAAATHLRGLFAVVDANPAGSGTDSRSSCQMLPHLALIILSLVSKAKTSNVLQSPAFPDPETPLFHPQPDDPAYLQPRYFTTEAAGMNDPVSPRAYATAVHLLVHVIAERVRDGASASFDLQILRWLVCSPTQHYDGNNSQLWLWGTVLSAYILLAPSLALPATATVRVWLGDQVERWKSSDSALVPDAIADAVFARLSWLLDDSEPDGGRSCIRALCYEAEVREGE